MFVKPMLAASMPDSKRDKVTYDNGYMLEPKHDGVRAIISKENDKVKIYSRVGNELTEHLPHLVEQLSHLPNKTVLDGELMVSAESVSFKSIEVPVPDFNMTMRILGSKPDVARQKQAITKVNFYVFDLLSYNGTVCVDDSYTYRQNLMRDNLADSANVMISEPWGRWDESDLDDLMVAGIEGAILKHKDSIYFPGKRRANTWYKVKITKTADVVVMGFTDANEGKTGRWLGKIGAIRFGVYDGDTLKEIGQCSGMTDAERDRWTSLRDSNNYQNRVIEIKYNDLVGDGTPRHPQYIAERIDKNPQDCSIDQFN